MQLLEQLGNDATEYSYGSALSALAKTGQWEDAFRLLDQVKVATTRSDMISEGSHYMWNFDRR